MSGQGLNAAVMTGQAGQTFAAQGGQALANYGDAAAAGAIGIGNAISGGIDAGLSAYKYFNPQSPPLSTAGVPGQGLY